jgi:membrane glycosyltransferase
MNFLKNSIVNAIFIGFMSAIYSFIFIFTSNHIEFLRLLSKGKTLQSDFWNGWSDFIRAGNMRYIGYAIIILTLIILLLMLFKRTKKYDEYQLNMLTKSLIIAGVLSILMIPIIMLLILSDPSYTIETIFLFAVVQWLGVLVAEIVYVIRRI